MFAGGRRNDTEPYQIALEIADCQQFNFKAKEDCLDYEVLKLSSPRTSENMAQVWAEETAAMPPTSLG